MRNIKYLVATALLLLIAVSVFGQRNRIKEMERARGDGYTIYTNVQGLQTYALWDTLGDKMNGLYSIENNADTIEVTDIVLGDSTTWNLDGYDLVYINGGTYSVSGALLDFNSTGNVLVDGQNIDITAIAGATINANDIGLFAEDDVILWTNSNAVGTGDKVLFRNGSGYDLISQLSGTGQWQFTNYNTTTSFPGTAIGLLGFDANGNVLTIDSSGFIITELDPIFTSHLSSSITEADTTRWGIDTELWNQGIGGIYRHFGEGWVAIGTTGNGGKGRLHVRGFGVTNATTAFSVENSGASPLFEVLDNGTLTLGKMDSVDFLYTDNDTLTGGAWSTIPLSEFINDIGAGDAEVNDLSTVVTWANVPDANITQSSVTQHEGALTIAESQITGLNYAEWIVDGDIGGDYTISDMEVLQIKGDPSGAIRTDGGGANLLQLDLLIANDAGNGADLSQTGAGLAFDYDFNELTSGTLNSGDIFPFGVSGLGFTPRKVTIDVLETYMQDNLTFTANTDAQTLTWTPSTSTLSISGSGDSEIMTTFHDLTVTQDVAGLVRREFLNTNAGTYQTDINIGKGTAAGDLYIGVNYLDAQNAFIDNRSGGQLDIMTNGAKTIGFYDAQVSSEFLYTDASSNVKKGTWTGSASSILTAIKTVDGTGSGLDADLLDGYTRDHFMYKNKYVGTVGYLIATDIAAASNVMFQIYIKGNSYHSTRGIIDIKVQGYHYHDGDAIISYDAIAMDYSDDIEVFDYNGYMHIWFPYIGYATTLSVFVNGTSGSLAYNRVTAITDVVKPVSGTTRDITITPRGIGELATAGLTNGFIPNYDSGINGLEDSPLQWTGTNLAFDSESVSTRLMLVNDVATSGFLLQSNLSGDAYVWNYEARPMWFGTSDITRMIIEAGGNVGVGVIDPSYTLDVGGQIHSNWQIKVSEGSPDIYLSDTDASADDFWMHANANTFYVLTDRDDNQSWDGSYPLALTNSNELGSIYGHTVLTNDGLTDQYIPYYENSTATLVNTNIITDGLGNIGINGAAVGGFQLNVETTGSANIRMYDKSSNYWAMRATTNYAIDRGGVEHFRITAGGDFGLGVTVPTEKAEIAGNLILDAANANLKIKAGVTGTKGDIQWTFNTDGTVYAWAGIEYDNRATDGFVLDSGYPLTFDWASGYLQFRYNGAELLRLGGGSLANSEYLKTVGTTLTAGDWSEVNVSEFINDAFVNDLSEVSTTTAAKTGWATEGLQIGWNTTGSTGFPTSIGGFIDFSTGIGANLSTWGRDFTLWKEFQGASWYLGGYDAAGARAPWYKILHSGNFEAEIGLNDLTDTYLPMYDGGSGELVDSPIYKNAAGQPQIDNAYFRINGTSPSVYLTDLDTGADDFWVHANSNTLYILTDRDDNGAHEAPYPLQLNNATEVGYIYGNLVWTIDNDGVGSGLDADLLDGVDMPNSSIGGIWTNRYIADVGTDGVMEVGRYIDFHHVSNDGIDYATRLNTNGVSDGELFINSSKIWHEGNDGSGSNLDADLLDGVQLSRIPYALNSGGVYGSTNTYTVEGGIGANALRRSTFFRDNNGQFGAIGVHMSHATNSNYAVQIASDQYGAPASLLFRVLNNGTWEATRMLWSDGNDGAGSGLDADYLDGQHGAYFTRGTGVANRLAYWSDANTLTNSSNFTIAGATLALGYGASFNNSDANYLIYSNPGADLPLRFYDVTNAKTMLEMTSQSLLFRTNNVERLRITDYGLQATNILTNTGQALILNAGESHLYATGQSNEWVYANAEEGLSVSTSPDNWTSLWAGRNETLIRGTSITIDGDYVVTDAAMSDNYVPVYDAASNNFENSIIYTDGTLVGIGAGTAPQQKLHIAGGGVQITGNIISPASGQKGLLLDYYLGNSRIWARGENATTRGEFNFYQLESDGGNQITAMTIKNGDVGIGTTVPSYNLDVFGSGRFNVGSGEDFIVQDNLTGGVTNVLWYDQSPSHLYFGSVNTPTEFRGDLEVGSGGSMFFVDHSSGDVGIGVTPLAKLHINQDVADEGLYVTGGSGGFDIARFQRDVGATGLIGIGASGANPQIRFDDEAGNVYSIGELAGSFVIGDGATVDVAPRLTIDFDGDVGIGTTTPTTALHVVGQTYTTTDFIAGRNIYANFSTNLHDDRWEMAPMSGISIGRNSQFYNDLSGYNVYDNASSGAVTLSRITDATAPNGSGYYMRYTYTTGIGTPSPGLGGFYVAYTEGIYEKGDYIVYSILAKIPVGYTMGWASNAVGTENAIKWLTGVSGTGTWKEYRLFQKIGETGSFSSTGFFYFSGADATINVDVARFNAVAVNRASSIFEQNDILYYRDTDVKIITEANIGAEIGLDGLTTNYVTKYNGTDLADSQIFDNGTNVGIGTTTPSVELEVIGDFYAGAGNFTSQNLVPPTSGKHVSVSVVGNAYGDIYAWDRTGATSIPLALQRFGGDVGIGTATPAYKQHTLDTNIGVVAAFESTGGANVHGLYVAVESNPLAGAIANHVALSSSGSNAGSFGFYTGNTERVRIAEGGNVGIGTATPAAKLDIDAGSNTTGIRLRGLAETVEIADIYLQANGALAISTVGGTASTAFIDIRPEDENYGLIVRDGTGATTNYANLFMNDAATDYLNIVVNNGNSVNGLVIDGNNNVGIGTATPTEKLVVDGAIVTTAPLTASQTNAGVFSRSNNEIRLRAYGATAGTGELVFRTGGGGGSIDTEAMRIDENQNVGISTTTPDGRLEINAALNGSGYGLHVNTNTRTPGEDYIWFGDDVTPDFVINTSNNVGIGTAAPSYPLDVVGTIKTSATFLADHGAGSGGTGLQLKSTGANLPFVQWHDGTTNIAGIRATSGGDFLFQTNGYNTRLSINSAGVVSIPDLGTADYIKTESNVLKVGDWSTAGIIASDLSDVYSKAEIRTITERSYTDENVQTSGGLAVGWYTIAINTGNRASARFGLWDVSGSRHQAVTFYATHMYGTDASNSINVLTNTRYGTRVFSLIRIKEYGTYDGAALQVYVADAGTTGIGVALLGDDYISNGWVLKDWIADATDPGGINNYGLMTAKAQVDLTQAEQGSMTVTGDYYGGGDITQYKMMSDELLTDQYIPFYEASTGKLMDSRFIVGTNSSPYVKDRGSSSGSLYFDVNTTSGYQADISVLDEGWVFNTNSSSRDYIFKQNGNEALRIDGSTRYVGINGVANPTKPLVVNGEIGLMYGDGNSYNGIKLASTYTEYFNGITGTAANVIHNFTGNGGAAKLSIQEGGLVSLFNRLEIKETSPDMYFNDTDASADDFFIHANSNTFYVLSDRDDNGSWDGTYPLQLSNSTEVGSIYGHNVWTDDTLIKDWLVQGDNANRADITGTGQDANLFWQAGFYTMNGTPLNVPEIGDAGIIVAPTWNSTSSGSRYTTQIFGKLGNPRIYFRNTDINGAGTWNEFWHEGNDSNFLLRDGANGGMSGTTPLLFNTGARIRAWGASDTDLTGLTGGTTAGIIMDSWLNGHVAVGIRGNDAADGFFIMGNDEILNESTYTKKLAAFTHTEALLKTRLVVDAFTLGVDSGIFLRDGFETNNQPGITVWDGTNGGASPDGLSMNAWDGLRFRNAGAEVARFKSYYFGVGTTTPTIGVESALGMRAGGKTFDNDAQYTAAGGGSANGFNIVLNSQHGTTLTSSFMYEITLNTYGTGTRTGSKFLVWHNGTVWTFRMVAQNGNSSNHPQLAISGSSAVAYTNHASAYPIWCNIVAYQNNNGTVAEPHVFGADYMFQRNVNDLYYLDGKVGVGVSPSYDLHVDGGFLMEDDIPILRIKDNNSAGGSSTGNVVFYDSGDVSKASISLANENIYFDATAAGSQVLFRPGGGTVNHMVVSDDQLDIFGDETIDVALIMTNQHHETASGITKIAGMGGYDATSSGYTASINFGKETTWTSTASTRDGKMSFLVSENGTLPIVMELASDGQLELSKYDGITFDDDNFTNATHAVTLDDGDGKVYKTRFESGTYTPSLDQITGSDTYHAPEAHRYTITGYVCTVNGRFLYTTDDANNSKQEYTVTLPENPATALTGNLTDKLHGHGTTMDDNQNVTPQGVSIYHVTAQGNKAVIFFEHTTGTDYVTYTFSYYLN